MKTLVLGAFLAATAAAQFPDIREPADIRLPSGKSQRDEILKREYEKARQESADLVKMAQELEAELKKEDQNVLSLGVLKKTEDIEKLAKRIRGRLKRF